MRDPPVPSRETPSAAGRAAHVLGGPRTFGPAPRGLTGRTQVPGDKSISHRAVLFGAISDAPVEITGFLASADTLATVRAVQALGVTVEERGADLLVHGRGWEGLEEPQDVIDVANAGTLIRLLPGLVAPLPFLTVLTGDASIRRRPMARVLVPLAAMGASVWGRAGDRLPPVAIRGGDLQGIIHDMMVASAQVKSCVLLAGLRARGETAVLEPAPSRDHTERMVAYGGGRVLSERGPGGANVVRVEPVERLHLERVAVPGDVSSAAFLLVAALLVPGSDLTVTDVGLNPTRTGLLEVLDGMGAKLRVTPAPEEGPEPLGSVRAQTSDLQATDVGGSAIPLLIDELPIWALAAARARGVSRLRDARELRVKESDRLAAVAALLRALGIEVTEHDDGLDIVGDPDGWEGGSVQAQGDHRLAMVGAVAGLASRRGVTVDDTASIAVSFPSFVATIEGLSGAQEER
jgi:3-phosphoshikimate 1-carboxyvinyltransferase